MNTLSIPRPQKPVISGLPGTSSSCARFSLIIAAACAAVFSMPGLSQAQNVEPQARHAIYVEGLGPTLGHSINYEHVFHAPYRLRVGVAPCAYQHLCWDDGVELSETHVTLIASRLFRHDGPGTDAFELGYGLKDGQARWHGWEVEGPLLSVYATVLVGYRYQPIPGGVVFRIGWTPLVGLNSSEDNRLMWGGISLGYAF